MQPKRSGNSGRYFMVLNWLSEKGLSLETWGRLWVLVTPKSVRGIQRAERGPAGPRGGQDGRRDWLTDCCPAGRAAGPDVITHEGLLVTGSGTVRKTMQPAAIDLACTCD